MHKHQLQHFQKISPFDIAPVKKHTRLGYTGIIRWKTKSKKTSNVLKKRPPKKTTRWDSPKRNRSNIPATVGTTTSADLVWGGQVVQHLFNRELGLAIRVGAAPYWVLLCQGKELRCAVHSGRTWEDKVEHTTGFHHLIKGKERVTWTSMHNNQLQNINEAQIKTSA